MKPKKSINSPSNIFRKEQIEYKQMLKNQRIKDQYQTLHECQELAQEAQERQ